MPGTETITPTLITLRRQTLRPWPKMKRIQPIVKQPKTLCPYFKDECFYVDKHTHFICARCNLDIKSVRGLLVHRDTDGLCVKTRRQKQPKDNDYTYIDFDPECYTKNKKVFRCITCKNNSTVTISSISSHFYKRCPRYKKLKETTACNKRKIEETSKNCIHLQAPITKRSMNPETNDIEIAKNTTDIAQGNYERRDNPEVQPLSAVRCNTKEDNNDATRSQFTTTEMDVVKILGSLTTSNRKAQKTVTTTNEGDKTTHEHSDIYTPFTTVTDDNIPYFKTSVSKQLGKNDGKDVSQQQKQKTYTIQIFCGTNPHKFKLHLPNCTCREAKAVVDKTTTDVGGSYLLIERTSNRTYTNKEYHGEVITIGEDTGRTSLETEKLLAKAISTKFIQNSNSLQNVSGAQCVLHNQPNAFVCICSQTKHKVTIAKNKAEETMQLGWKKNYTDCADYICVVPKIEVINLLREMSPNNYMWEIQKLQNTLLRECGLSHKRTVTTSIDTFVGHHLKTVLPLLPKHIWWLLVIVRKQSKSEEGCFTLHVDIPGGKRHLGESPYQCAVRELQEETSLQINRDWLMNKGNSLNSGIIGEKCNTYYLACPPDTCTTTNT